MGKNHKSWPKRPNFYNPLLNILFIRHENYTIMSDQKLMCHHFYLKIMKSLTNKELKATGGVRGQF